MAKTSIEIKTSLVLALALTAATILLVEAQNKVISVNNGVNDRGAVWGEWERCPTGFRADSFTTQNDLANVLPTADASALNSIVLFCDDASATNISSALGFEGTFAGRTPKCTGAIGRPAALSSFRLRVVALNAPNVTDNTAANNIEFTCTNGNLISGTGNNQGDWGDFSDNCDDQGGICGIRTLQKPQGSIVVDNTALNDVQFECCA